MIQPWLSRFKIVRDLELSFRHRIEEPHAFISTNSCSTETTGYESDRNGT